MVKKVITNLDSSKASSPDCIPVVVVKNCEPKLSYILNLQYVSERALFSRLLEGLINGPCIQDCWGKVYCYYCPVSLLAVVSKVFEKLVNNRIVDHLEKYGLFSDFQYGFRSS